MRDRTSKFKVGDKAWIDPKAYAEKTYLYKVYKVSFEDKEKAFIVLGIDDNEKLDNNIIKLSTSDNYNSFWECDLLTVSEYTKKCLNR